MCFFIEFSADGWKLETLSIGFEKSYVDSKTEEQFWLELCDAVEVVGLTENELK